MQAETIRISMVPAFWELGIPARNKTYYGGRGGAKSWQFARALIGYAHTQKERILCTREYQSSIADSVHRLLCDQIYETGLSPWFNIQDNIISSRVTGSEFIFKGLRRDPNGIKSTEGITKCWVEEAQTISNDSLNILIPTIRREGSEIWVSFNTGEIDDPVYKYFVLNPPPGSIVRKVGYADNPYFPATLEAERLHLQRVDPEAYDNVWEGNPKHISDACIFKGKFEVRDFETPSDVRLYYGADWGFGPDPSTLVRCFIRDDRLYIDHEAYALGLELEDLEDLYDTVPGSREWPIGADNSRPETIKFVKKKAFESVAFQNHGNETRTNPRPMRRAASRKGSPSSANLKKWSFIPAASTQPRSLNSIVTRRIRKLEKSCRSLSTQTTTSSTLCGMPSSPSSRAVSIGRVS